MKLLVNDVKSSLQQSDIPNSTITGANNYCCIINIIIITIVAELIDAAHTYFTSLRSSLNLMKKGKYKNKVNRQRKRNRQKRVSCRYLLKIVILYNH